MTTKRTTANWLLELTSEEGELVLALVDKHREAAVHAMPPHLSGYDPECAVCQRHGPPHKAGYDHNCLLCRAGSRISLGRDQGWSALWPETQEEVRSILKAERK